MIAPVPINEKERLQVLNEYDILDTEPEQSFDDLTLLASQICNTPIAWMSLIDEKRQWFKSKIGLTLDEAPRDIAFCAHTILQKDLLVVGDALADERFATNPLVTGDPHIRFYAGLPIILAEGHALGAICVSDRVPRNLTPEQRAGLEALRRQVIAQLELRRSLKAKMKGEAELLASELSYRRLFEAAKDGILILDFQTGRITDVNPFLVDLLSFSKSDMLGKTVGELSPFKDIESNKLMLEHLQKDGYVRYEDLPLKTSDGRHIAVEFVSNVYPAGDKQVIQCNVRDITARKKSEEQLTMLNTCVGHLNEIILVTEADIEMPGPKIVFVNAAFERITGYSLAEALGQSPRFLQGEKTDRRTLDEIHQALLRGEAIQRQVLNYKKDGTEYWAEMDIVPVLNSAGKCTHFAAIERDITESRKLKESLKLFRTLMDRSPDAIEVIDPETGRFLDFNETSCRRLGYTREEMLNLSIPDVLDTGDVPFSMQANLEESRRAEARTIESRHRRKDGSSFPIEINTQYVELDRPYLLAVIRDVTERHEMEQTLRESEAKFRTLFEVANDAHFILHNGVFVDCNAKALEFFGVSREELIGQPPTLFSPTVQPDGRNSELKAMEYMERALAGESQFFEWVNKRPNGRVIHADVTLNRFELGGKLYLQTIVRDITERKEVEKQLLWKTAFFEAQVNSSLDGIIVVDSEGRMVLQNRKMIDLWHPPQDIFDELDHRKRMAWVAGQVVNPEEFSEKVSYLYAHPDEISRDELELVNGKYFDRYTAPVIGRDRKCFGRIWAYRDITERKQAEEKQRASEERYRTLFDYAPDGIVIADPKGTYIDGNASMCRMLGYTRDELIGCNASDIVAESEIPKIEGALIEIKEEALHHREWQFRRKDGWLFPAEVIVTPMPDGNLLGMIRDTSERKRSEEQIAEQATLLDKAQDAIFVRDMHGKMLFWNKGAERMYGWARHEVVERTMDEFLYTNPQELAEAYRLTTSQGDWHGELRHFTKDGSELIIESRWTLIRDKDGFPKSVLAINTDITEKKIIEAQFMRAQRMESLGTLAGGIAHDLNNILAPIMMSIELLKETSTDPVSTNILKTIEVSAKRGADIVRQVLSFARGLEGERIEVQLKHLLNEIQSIIKDTFPKDIRLEFSVPNDIWTILGDPTQVHQILLNLCVNARDAMPNGGNLFVNVENCVLDEHYVAMNLQAKAGRYVLISVADTGTGIPPTLLEKIFEPFFTTKPINKGTGLGLSTVMAIVKSHNGLINVYSDLNKGTTFKVYLPAMEMSSEARKEQLAQASLPRGNGETVLLVDDEVSILTITTQTLLAFGYQVLTATDGAEAVAIYAECKNDIAVVLTDMAMPIMDGAATIRALTKMNPRLKIIAASGLHANADMTNASGVGIRHFLTKPYTAGLLLKTLRTILDEA